MKDQKKRKILYSSVTRMLLFLVVFIFSIILQLFLSTYKNSEILNPIMDRGKNIQVLSSFLGEVEDFNYYLSSYRWDYGDLSNLSLKNKQFNQNTLASITQMESFSHSLTDEEAVLYNALTTTYESFKQYIDQIVAYLQKNDFDSATSIYYTLANPCGDFLSNYSRSMLECYVEKSSEVYNTLGRLNDILNRLENLSYILILVFGFLVVHDFINIIRSLSILTKAAKAIGSGNYDYPDVSAYGSIEIEKLSSVFNEMKNNVKNNLTLLEEKHRIENELLQKEAEAVEFESILEREKLQKLRSQINPHFLFNTLNTVVYSASQEGAEKTKKLLSSLSNLFRYSLASNDFYVPLSQEIRIVNEFYLLYHERFQDRILLRWDIDPLLDLTEVTVPSFILQPLVENSFKKGLLPLENGGCVNIIIRLVDDNIKFTVSDNGVGISREHLNWLKENIKEQISSGEHLGLYNVAARLRLSGNGDLTITSKEGEGTIVEFKVKLSNKGESYD